MSALSDRIAGHADNVIAAKRRELEAWQNFRRAAMSRGGMPDLPTIAELNSAIAGASDAAHKGMHEIDVINGAINEPDMPQQTPAGQIAPKTSNAASPRKSAQYTPVPGAGPTTGGGNGGSYAMRRSPYVNPHTGSMYVKYTDGELRERLEKISKARSRLLDELSRRDQRDRRATVQSKPEEFLPSNTAFGS